MSTTATDHARAAYQALEPIHIVAYFSPLLADRGNTAGLHWRAAYVGMRAQPLGPCDASVVCAAFYSWNSDKLGLGWHQALEVGLERIRALRTDILDQTLREIWGEGVHSTELAAVAADLRAVAERLPVAGRALAAAWASQPWPEEPHLALWHATTLLREWRGDGHIAALVLAGLDPVEAIVFHEAVHPDPRLRRSLLGRQMLQRTRGWSDDDWSAAASRLGARGLLEPAADPPGDTGDSTAKEALSTSGAALFGEIEQRTDDAAASIWADPGRDPAELFARARPWAKAVIDTGILPGTTRKTPA